MLKSANVHDDWRGREGVAENVSPASIGVNFSQAILFFHPSELALVSQSEENRLGIINLSKAEIGSKWKRRDGQMYILIAKQETHVVVEKPNKLAEYCCNFDGRMFNSKSESPQDIVAPWLDAVEEIKDAMGDMKFEAVKIEQKLVCWCCSKQYAPNAQKDEEFISHEDPCEFSHLERDMPPIQKALFRRDMLAREKAYDVVIDRREDMARLNLSEDVLAGRRENGTTPREGMMSLRTYKELTQEK